MARKELTISTLFVTGINKSVNITKVTNLNLTIYLWINIRAFLDKFIIPIKKILLEILLTVQ